MFRHWAFWNINVTLFYNVQKLDKFCYLPSVCFSYSMKTRTQGYRVGPRRLRSCWMTLMACKPLR